MNIKEFIRIWDEQRPLFSMLRDLKNNTGMSAASVHLLQVMNERRGSGRIINPGKLLFDCYKPWFRSVTIRWLRNNGYITKLSKFEYRFEDKAVSFVDEFNAKLEAKIEFNLRSKIK